MDRFVVELALKSGEHLPLFTFLGEGAVTTGALGALLGDDWLDAEGKQEEEARGFVEHLRRLTKLVPRSFLYIGRNPARTSGFSY